MAQNRTTHRCHAKEILLQWTLATGVILQRNIPVRAERAGKYSNVPKHRFPNANSQIIAMMRFPDVQRFVQYVGHLVFEVLRSH